MNNIIDIDPYDTITVICYAIGTTILAESEFFIFVKNQKKFFSWNLVFDL